MRSEHWYVLKGDVTINLEFPNGDWQIQMLTEHTNFVIQNNWWHKVTNEGDKPAHILEVQYGENCIEEDIIRR